MARRRSTSNVKPPSVPDAGADDAPDDALSPTELEGLHAQCTRFLRGYGQRSPADELAAMAALPAADLAEDWYGESGVVALLEGEVRSLLGKPAAVFMPSGTMAQQIALRNHADRRDSRVVAFHPTCHLEIHEDRAYEHLHGLTARLVGEPDALITLADLEAIDEPLAALILELPQREIGGRLPSWEDLVAQVDLARSRGWAVHMDGARLWESAPFYGRPPAEIAALFDTVYVSFYKGLGGLTGAMLLGEEDVISEARVWRHRHGGTLFKLWPYAASALASLRTNLPKLSDHLAHTRAIAAQLEGIAGIEVVPNSPQVPMCHLYLETTMAAVSAGIRRLATEEHIWGFAGAQPTSTPGVFRVELFVGDATLGFTPAEVAHVTKQLLPQ
jgi:threonine aldolase